MRFRITVYTAITLSFALNSIAAQSPNTASMIVAVTEQTGAVIPNAKVSVLNTATGAVRELLSGTDGTATIPG